MKMMYERPTMKAELFRTNDYIAACNDDPHVVGGSDTVVMAEETGTWYDVPMGGASNIQQGGAWDGNPSDYSHLTFSDRKAQWSESAEKWQYYWTAVDNMSTEDDTSDDVTYYLEYSAGWTEKGGNGKDVFVLYQEDANGTGSNKANELNVNWSWMGWNEIVGNRYDTVIAGIVFNDRIIANS